ncbi:MAG: primosomal protein N' [Spirochaetia bacterium]
MSGDPVYLDVAFNVPVDAAFTYLSTEDIPPEPVGCRVAAPFGSRKLIGYVVDSSRTPPEGLDKIKKIERFVDSDPLFHREYLSLARWTAKMYYSALGETLSAMLPGGKRETEPPALLVEEDVPEERPKTLSMDQQAAIERIEADPRGMHYLYGITGSGKTEVFLQLAEKIIMAGKSVIYLVPEIALTTQIVAVIKKRFNETASIIHSRLTPSQKLSEWRMIRSGKSSLVVGARSAVFAPVARLGMIILDEEHEGAYKSSASPRYHARQVAMKRCADTNALLVMGSATPSVEAYHLMEKGGIIKHELKSRVAGGGLPGIVRVDMSLEKGILSDVLLREMKKTLAEKRQIILFLNRRGFSYFFHCRSCGFQMKCSRCSVSLTYHKNRGEMLCHYCGFRQQPVDTCPDCGSLDVGYFGFGTEMIEEELLRLFPGAEINRLDTDSVRKKGELEKRIAEFRSGKIDILVGTQMVAKGLNFPGVKLVGIVMADTGLHLPDFRASERTHSLIVQVAGRAGRYHPDGKVVVQTFRPDYDAVKYAATGEAEQFYLGELDTRKELDFPPYSRLFRFVFRGKNLGNVIRCSRDFTAALKPVLSSKEQVLGPVECPLGYIARNHRYHLIVVSHTFNSTHNRLRTVYSGFSVKSGVYIETDVDPVNLL